MKLTILALCLGIVIADPVWAANKKHHKKTYSIKHHKKHAKGLRRHDKSKKFLKGTQKISFLNSLNPIPGNADISAKVSLPENQGQCGSCWDFSLTKALRSALMVTGRDPGQLEFNYLLNNCGAGPRMYGCNGGDFDAAQSFENNAGPGLNANNPYTQRASNRCSNQPVAATAISYAMLGGNNGPAFKDLANAVGNMNQMLSIDVSAGSGDWENYDGGIYNGCSGGANQIDHMIDMVGYDCETSKDAQGNCVFDASGNPVNGDGYIIVENNWGENWGTQAANGHGGYMKTRFMVDGEKCNAVATNALMFSVAQPAPPVPPTPPVPPVPPTPPVPPAPVVKHGFLCGVFSWLPWCH